MASTANLDSSSDAKNATGSGSECSERLLKLLDKMKGFAKKSSERSNNNQEDKSVLPELEQLHSEIVSVQEGVEGARLFDGGAELYSNWLELALRNCSEESIGDGTPESESAREKDLIKGVDGKEKEGIRRLIALAYNNRGYLKYLQVDFEGAITDYTKALSHNPNLSEAYYNRGLVTYRLAFFDQSVEDMTQAVKLDPSRVEFQEGLTRVKEMIGSPNGHNFKLKADTVEDAEKKRKLRSGHN